MSGEFDYIRWLQDSTPQSDRVFVGIGDDMAAIRWKPGDLLLVAADQVLDGVHFDSARHGPRAIGRKLMNRNLSDCAAMACLPVAAVVTAALPRGAGLDYARELHAGIRDAGEPFGCEVIGGDTAVWDGKLAMSLSILGASAGFLPITRSGARAGDGIYVTGPLGGSGVRDRHMTFTPRIHEARLLAGTGFVRSMIDLSDGLSRDLGHICRESRVGAVIDAAAVPIHSDVPEGPHAERLAHALDDGEDHELLLTAVEPPGPGAVRIGTITAESGLWLDSPAGRTPLEPRGWEHRL